MNRLKFFLLLACGVTACAPAPPTPMGWYKAGTTDAEFQRDNYGCMREAARMFPPTAGVEGIADRDGGVMSSYDISQGSRNNAASTCMRSRGYQLSPLTAQASATVSEAPKSAPAAPVLICKGDTFKAAPSAAPKQINGGVLRFQVTQQVITVTTADGGVVAYRVTDGYGSTLVASRRDSDGSQYDVHVSVKERYFAMMHVVSGQPMEALTGPCT